MSFETSGALDMSTPEAKREAYRQLRAQVQSVFEGERNQLANLAQFSALIFGAVPDLNWAGFYMADDGGVRNSSSVPSRARSPACASPSAAASAVPVRARARSSS